MEMLRSRRHVREIRNKSSTSRKLATRAKTSLGRVSRRGGDQTLPRPERADESSDSEENTSEDPPVDVAA